MSRALAYTKRYRTNKVLSLRDLGNTVIVVEHDEDIMKAADMIIDIGQKLVLWWRISCSRYF
jgi:ABC-type siderophore export system fused ATPase/permease subunit